MSSYNIDKAEEILEVFESIRKNNKTDYLNWIAYTHKLMKSAAKFTGGTSPEELVDDLITDTICGKRTWDRERVDLNTFMYKNIRSKFSNLIKRESKFVRTDDIKNENDEENSFMDNNHYISLDEINEEMDFKELEERCYKELEDDEEAYLIFYEILKGNQNKNIAEELGIKVSKVEAAKKRIRRRLNGVYKDFLS